MTTSPEFDRTVATWLHSQAGAGTPAYLGDIVTGVEHTRQRPGWSSLGRWLPMQATAQFAPVQKMAWLVVVAALLIVVAAAVLLAGSQPRRPAPFGPAANGSIVYASSDGDIHAVDPATGRSTAIVIGETNDLAPDFSHDGSKFVFARSANVAGASSAADSAVIVLADSAGAGQRVLTDALVGLSWYAWSPNDRQLAVVAHVRGIPSIHIISVDGAPPRTLAIDVQPELVQWRPDGRQLVFMGTPTGASPETHGLYVVGVDGTSHRSILSPTDVGGHPIDLALSPNGQVVASTDWDADIGGRIRLVGVDDGHVQRLVFDGATAGDWGPAWSPDGARLVFTRLDGHGSEHLAVAPAGGGHVLEIGPKQAALSGGIGAAFSPDGSSVIARYADGSTRVLDPAGGAEMQLASSDFLASWQRLAP